MDLFGSVYRYIKIGFSSVGLISSVSLTVYGVASNQNGYIIYSVFVCGLSVLALIDSSKLLADMIKQVNVLKGENSKLASSVIKLDQTVLKSEEQVAALKKNINQLEDSLLELRQFNINLKSHNETYQRSNMMHKALVEEAKTANKKLTEEIELLNFNNLELNAHLQNMKINNDKQNENLTKQADEIKRLVEQNIELAQTVDKLKVVYQKSMELVRGLTAFGSQSEVISTQLTNTKEELKEHVDSLNNLVQTLTLEKFKQMDTDSSGSITLEEWVKALNSTRKK